MGSKRLEGGYVGDYIGEYYRGYILGVYTMAHLSHNPKGPSTQTCARFFSGPRSSMALSIYYIDAWTPWVEQDLTSEIGFGAYVFRVLGFRVWDKFGVSEAFQVLSEREFANPT